MPFKRRVRRVLGGVLIASSLARPVLAVNVPSDFVIDNAVPATTFTQPTAMAFLPDGAFIVCEQAGIATMVRNGIRLANPVWSSTSEVLSTYDRGLLGVAVDPAYFINHFVYFLYTVEPDTSGQDASTPGFGRLTRFRMRSVGDTNTVDPSTRTVLLGVDWRHGILDASTSHSIGSLRWGRDGSLLVSAGEGAEFIDPDAGGRNPLSFGDGKSDPYDDIGAFRAQDITTLNGKILRINPVNGHGYMSNPFRDADLGSIRSRVWAYGLRNPFRFTVRPGTGSADTTAADPGALYIGDVGWYTWEEMDVDTQPGTNFGWPCFEGTHFNTLYQAATPAHNGCGSVGSATNPNPWQLPAADWNHNSPLVSSPPGAAGNTSVGGAFYSDALYPANVRGRYFFADYGASWIRTATFSGKDHLLSIQDFGTNMDAPVDIERSPINGDLYYVSITTGQIRRIRYTGAPGGNAPPVARATGLPGVGAPPLTVNFTGDDSFDPEGDALSYAWTFGDGGASTLPNPSHIYAAIGPYTATLTVSDGHGGQDQTQVVTLVLGNSPFPSTAVLDNFNRGNGAIGGSWAGATGGLSIQANAAVVAADATAFWNTTVFGPNQECFVTIKTPSASASEIDLMLKAQGVSATPDQIELWYDPPGHAVHVSTFDAVNNWQAWGVITGVTFSAGDQFGARAFINGVVDVFRNQVKIGSVSVASWSSFDQGGRIGMNFSGANGVEVDDFGGGDWSVSSGGPIVSTLSPNGGESWVGGSSHAITWSAADNVAVTGIDVYFRDAPASAWTPLALGVPNTGSFTWFVPNTPTASARVRVVAHDGDGNQSEDLSDADFTITRQGGGLVATTLRDFTMPGTQPLEAGGFQNHSNCLTCHGGYDNAVEPGHNFDGTMMSQAARDPLFYACLAVTEQDAPSAGDLCIRCHSPFAWLSGHSQPTNGSQIDAAGRDGVSCDLCHRLVDPLYKPGVSPPGDLALISGMLPSHRPTGYSNGQYVVDPNAQARGPFADATAPHSFLASSFHESSELCGTCHDVSNPVYTRLSGSKYAAGPLDTPADSVSSLTLMPLERTFSEWKNSAFPAGVTLPDFAGNNPGGVVSACQDCHVRSVTGRGCSTGGAPLRNNLPLHDMMGGNAWMGGVIASLYPTEVDPAALTDGSARAVAMLTKAATVKITLGAVADSFTATVTITNRTGHKLPTGYPEGRRMWVNLRARNSLGAIVYESGAYDGSTGILAQDAQARVYEAHLGLSPGVASSIGLAPGASFHFALNDTLYKDNRIPPLGFTNAAYASFGGAPVDPAGPSPRYPDGQNWDNVVYGLPASTRTVAATLYYQTTSKNYVEFLRDANVSNTAGQTAYDAWTSHGRAPPVVMASDSTAFNQTGVPDSRTPRQIALRAGQNPFVGPLELMLALPRPAAVRMEVLDVSGRIVARISRGTLPAGEHRLSWDGRDASGHDAGAGVFWAVVHAEDQRLVRRVVRLR